MRPCETTMSRRPANGGHACDDQRKRFRFSTQAMHERVVEITHEHRFCDSGVSLIYVRGDRFSTRLDLKRYFYAWLVDKGLHPQFEGNKCINQVSIICFI